MAPYPGAVGSTTQVNSNVSPEACHKGMHTYVFGKTATGDTQLYNTQPAFETTALAVESSKAVCIESMQGDPPPAISVEVSYASAPGAGESIAIQEADTDADAFYITPNNSAYVIPGSALNAYNIARVDLSPTGGRFLRLQRTVGANNVGCRAKITRLA